MKLSLIFAHDLSGGIGYKGPQPLPWHYKEDLINFKRLTLGSSLIMGNDTFKSLPGVLPGRFHTVLTRTPPAVMEDYTTPSQVEYCSDVPTALTVALHRTTTDEIFVIGGASVLDEFLPYATAIHRTFIDEHLLNEARGELAIPRRVLAAFDDGSFERTHYERFANHPSLIFETWRKA